MSKGKKQKGNMRTISVLLGLMMASTIIFAQRKGEPMNRAGAQADKMKTELSLDDVQYKAVKAINEDFVNKRLKLHQDSTMSRQEIQKQARTLRDEKNAAIAKVLTPEQKSKWKSYRASQTEKHKAGRAKYRGEHARRMQEQLSLSDEQTSKIKSIDKEFGDKFRALRNDSTIAREDLREKAKQLRQEYLSKTKSVLTEEQFKKWELQKADRKRRKF
jgi:Spy/CpxP family protein refolding chaperone